jgi:hypothetical protein
MQFGDCATAFGLRRRPQAKMPKRQQRRAIARRPGQVRSMHRVRGAMSVDLLWSWMGMTALGIGVTSGIWWALADYILDRVGPAPADWGSHDRR